MFWTTYRQKRRLRQRRSTVATTTPNQPAAAPQTGRTLPNIANTFPSQKQSPPGSEEKMNPKPIAHNPNYRPAAKLQDLVAIVTGGDSGIGRAVSLAFAQEGAHVAICYLNEHEDAKETQRAIEAYGRRCLLIAGDLGQEKHCAQAVDKIHKEFGQIDILVNNAAEQTPKQSILDISAEQLERTFRTNLFAYFYMAKAVLPHLLPGATIINTASITAYKGNKGLVDYAATKGAIVTFTRSLSEQLIGQGIRVNGVAPGPIWTPLIVSTFDPAQSATFGTDTPMKRAGQPFELAPAYVYLASDDSSYMAGQILHINGGEIVNG